MLENLNKLIDEVSALQSKLVLLIGPPGCGKTTLIEDVAAFRGASVMNVGAALGQRLAVEPQRRRALQASVIMSELANEFAGSDLLLLDNIELLFDKSLRLDPLGVLKRYAHSRNVVAVWPGVLDSGRLKYAQMGHPEYQDYGLDGLVTFQIKK